MKKIIIIFVILFTSNYANASGYTDTRYPIVLVHGVSGFDSIGGLVNYFHTIPFHLERSGAKVYVPSVTAFNSSQQRGQELVNFLEQLPEDKFNLIGHSQGSPTARVAAALAPQKIVSVTSVNGVNQGTPVADLLVGVLPQGSLSNRVISNIVDAVGNVIGLLSGGPRQQDSLAALATLSTQGTLQLNQQLGFKGISQNCNSISENVNISGNNIKMFSWTGSRPLTNFFDISDAALGITRLAFLGENNDGLVSVCSAKLGSVIGVYSSLNHLDAVNHLFGVRGWVNPVSLYRGHANRLKNRGL